MSFDELFRISNGKPVSAAGKCAEPKPDSIARAQKDCFANTRSPVWLQIHRPSASVLVHEAGKCKKHPDHAAIGMAQSLSSAGKKKVRYSSPDQGRS